jgi:hypothetical protein
VANFFVHSAGLVQTRVSPSDCRAQPPLHSGATQTPVLVSTAPQGMALMLHQTASFSGGGGGTSHPPEQEPQPDPWVLATSQIRPTTRNAVSLALDLLFVVFIGSSGQ